MDYTPDNIKELPPNGVFVFGSNRAGIHGKGAALTAARKFGAVRGYGSGLAGRSYALATKLSPYSKMSEQEIFEEFVLFLKTVKAHPELHFYLTKVGTGLSGYSCKLMAELLLSAADGFVNLHKLKNLSIPADFAVEFKRL